MKILELSFGTFEFFADIIIGKINDGVHYDAECNDLLVASAIAHYGANHILGYISIRENDYSVDPMIYLNNKLFKDLACISILEKNKATPSTVEIEARFFKEEKFKSFSNAEEALAWTNTQIASSLAAVFNPTQLN
jgi:hypothetical protein